MTATDTGDGHAAAEAGPKRPATAAGGRRSTAAFTERLLVIAFGLIVLAGWEIGCRVSGISNLVLPTPTEIVGALIDGIRTGQILSALQVTFIEIALGFIFAALSAIALGTLVAQIRLVEAVLMPYIVGIQTLPKVALAPLILVWVGFGVESKILISALVAFFPILVNTIVGLKATPPEKIELLRSLSANRWKIFRYVQFPEALPFIFAGLNIGIVMAVLGAIVGEFIGSKDGLGYLLLQMNYSMDISGMFSILIVLAILGIVLNALAQYARRKIIFWQRDNPLEL